MREEAVLATEETQPAELNDVGDVWEILQGSVRDIAEGFVANLPLYVLALVVFLLGALLTRFAVRAISRGLERTSLDGSLQRLTLTVSRVALLTMAALIALSVAGIGVGSALAALGLAGLALAFAFQNILENFIAGLLILIRRPFTIDDQIISGDYEGTVTDIDMRVTRLIGYDGVSLLLPNADVFKSPLVNLTQAGRRRTEVMIGIDYRDDHHTAGDIIREAVAAVDGVLDDPAVEVLLTELGSSSVDFEIRYWTLPDIGSVRRTQDGVLKAAKSAVEDAGMTIPWPIRTLEPGEALRVTTRTAE